MMTMHHLFPTTTHRLEEGPFLEELQQQEKGEPCYHHGCCASRHFGNGAPVHMNRRQNAPSEVGEAIFLSVWP
jgi:hypothetical protein